MENINTSCEPMDIDLSSQSVKDMDISYHETSVPVTPSKPSSHDTSPAKQSIVKKFHINIEKPPRSSKNTFLKITVALIIILISIITYQIHSLKCCDQLNLEVFSETLSKKLFGQSVAINLLIKSLELKVNSKILFLSGGTGVGKTFTSSLLLDTVGSCSNVYHYTMPTFKNTFSTDLMFGLTMCKISLIIVDDLTIEDMDVKEEIKDVIEKSENMGKEITVILIFNCNDHYRSSNNRCDESFKRQLFKNFSGISAIKTFIQFVPLSEKHLEECIKEELGTRKLSNIEFNNVIKNFNVSVDGCKGVHSKLKYLLTV